MAYSTIRSLWPIDQINFRQLLLLLFLLFLGGRVAEAGEQPVALRGTLDLRKVDFTKQIIPLQGQWKWYWHQLRSPSQPESTAEYVDFPSSGLPVPGSSSRCRVRGLLLTALPFCCLLPMHRCH
ncbi:hypothetical protein [Spirosoma linguale]|uniref:hypothetical protein n=1 Tax=Spirosoma linguale TaxID=108 RepID=UPI0001A3C572